jgi:hypothetical protein
MGLKSEIMQNSLLAARSNGWSLSPFLNCREVKCRNHKDNMDETYESLGLDQPERLSEKTPQGDAIV